MKKSYLFGGIITAVVFCAVFVFNSFVSPFVLASTPDDGGIITLESDDLKLSNIDLTDDSEEVLINDSEDEIDDLVDDIEDEEIDPSITEAARQLEEAFPGVALQWCLDRISEGWIFPAAEDWFTCYFGSNVIRHNHSPYCGNCHIAFPECDDCAR